APFAVIGDLVALKKAKRAIFETLRTRLKKAGCRVGALCGWIAEENGEQRERIPTAADLLVELAEVAELFHTSDEIGFADLEINGHRETSPIRPRGFRLCLSRLYYEEIGGAPNSEAMAAAINVIEAKALHNPTVRT